MMDLPLPRLLVNAAQYTPRSHVTRASFLSRRRRLPQYYTKKVAFLSVPVAGDDVVYQPRSPE